MSETGDRPNVVWIVTDQHSYRALGCAGHPTVETPNVDRLAERGVRFERAYCPSPVCGPSRGALFTGLYPRANGMTGNNERIRRDVPILPERLRAAGYHTGLAGKLHFAPNAAPHGFDYDRRHDAMYDTYYAEEPWRSEYVEWLADERFDGDREAVIERANADEEAIFEDDLYRFLLGSNWRSDDEHSNTWVTDESVRFLREVADEPFFLFSSYFGPHQPMAAPGEWADRYDPDDVELPPEFDLDPAERPIAARKLDGSAVAGFSDGAWTPERYREVLAAYYGQVSMIDRGVGRILDALDDEGLAGDTVVVFAADHGDHAGQFGWFFKGTMYEGAARVPLVVDDPAGAAGASTDHVVNTLGLHDTLLERCGVERPAGSHSRSLRPLLADPDAGDWRDETYAELGGQSTVVRGDRKLVRARGDDGYPIHELYDCSAPVDDERNLWDDVGGDERQALAGRLDAWEEWAARPRAGSPAPE